ncbi:hypothetical protein [Actinomadura geliboluensis]
MSRVRGSSVQRGGGLARRRPRASAGLDSAALESALDDVHRAGMPGLYAAVQLGPHLSSAPFVNWP